MTTVSKVLPVHRLAATALVWRAMGKRQFDSDFDYQRIIATVAEDLAAGRCAGLVRRGNSLAVVVMPNMPEFRP